MKKLIFILLVQLLALTSYVASSAQGCYNNLDDVSGYDRSTYYYVVEGAACSLLDSLPANLRDSFGIYGFGFYRLVDHYGTYSYDDIFRKVIKDDVDKPYYIIFGRESGKNGIYTHTRVRVNLPLCMNLGDKTIDAWVETQMETKIKENLQSPPRWAQAEAAAINEYLKIYLPTKDCCKEYWKALNCGISCVWTKKKIEEYHQGHSFATEEATSSFNGVIDSCTCKVDVNGPNNPYIFSYDKLEDGQSYRIEKQLSINKIQHRGREIEFDSLYVFLQSLGEEYANDGKTFYAALTDQTIFCYGSAELSLSGRSANKNANELNYRNVEERYSKAEVAVWYDLYYDKDGVRLSVKTKGMRATNGMPTDNNCAQAVLAKDKILLDLMKGGDMGCKYSNSCS